MGDDGKKRLIPKLRFPEFRDTDGWQETSIEALARVTQGGTPDTSNVEYWGGTINWLTPAEMNKDDSPYIASTKRTLTEAGLANCSSDILPSCSVIISTRAPIGHLAINTTPMAINQGCRGLVPVENAYFLYSALLHAKARLIDLGAGNTFKELSGSALKRFVIPAPLPAEQQKIADCLTSLDELIAAQGRKVEALKAHKKGLMQQLFPREGETVPRLRFPEFRDAGEWKEKRIADLEPFVTSGSRGWAAYYAESGSLFVRITNLSRESIYLDLSHTKYVDLPPDATEGVRTQIKRHDVLVSVTADIGMIGYVDADIPSPAYINQHIALVRFTTAEVHSRFVAYFLASETSQRRFMAATDNGTKAGMNLMAVQSIPLALPSPAEQQRIADCLSALDARLTAESRKLDALKLHKRGLMQQLFPAAEQG